MNNQQDEQNDALAQALTDYVDLLNSGERPSEREFASGRSAIAVDLASLLQVVRLVKEASPPQQTRPSDDQKFAVLRSQLSGKEPPTVTRRNPMAWGLTLAAAAGFVALAFYVLVWAPPPKIKNPASEDGPKTPEAVFQKLVETLETSKTARLRFTFKGIDPSGNQSGMTLDKSGTILFKGEKVHLTIREGPDVEIVIVSNGDKLWDLTKFKGKQMPAKEREAPKGLRRKVVSTLVATGNYFAIPAAIRSVKADGADWSPDGFVPSQFQHGPDEGTLKVLKYSVPPFEARIWYDPKTHQMHKRVMTNSYGTFTESYEEYALAVEIRDDEFSEPAKK